MTWRVTKASVDRTVVHLVAGERPKDYRSTVGADVITLCGMEMRARDVDDGRPHRVKGTCRWCRRVEEQTDA